MSMFDDVMGFGRTSVMESMMGEFEPEVEETTLESVAALDESVDPMDFILQVAYENEMNMKNLDMAIMAEEYMFLRESGQEMVYEETKMQSVIDKFKNGVKWLWEQIQKFFKTVMKKIDDALKLDQRFLDKYKSKAAGKTAQVNGLVSLMDVAHVAEKGKKVIDLIAKEGDRVTGLLDKDQASLADLDINRFYGTINITVSTATFNKTERGGNTKDFVKVFLKDKNESKKVQTFKADDAIEQFVKSKGVKADLKDYYNENKKAINAQIKSAKAMERLAKKHKVIPTETSKNIHGAVKYLNKLSSTMTLINRTYVKLINMARAQYKAIIVAAAAKDIKTETTSVIDSVEFGMTF